LIIYKEALTKGKRRVHPEKGMGTRLLFLGSKKGKVPRGRKMAYWQIGY